MKVLFTCRNSVLKKRAFIEFAILKTQGYSTIPSDWRAIRAEFKVFFAENKADLIYTLPNGTALIGENFSKAVQRYFDFLNNEKVKRAFGIREDKIAWVINIRIEEAYATPTCLLTGLLSKYEEKGGVYKQVRVHRVYDRFRRRPVQQHSHGRAVFYFQLAVMGTELRA